MPNKYISYDEMMEILDNKYLLPFRKDERLRGLNGIDIVRCEDGTLEVKVEDATKVGRVLISDDKHRGGLYYPDEDEPQGDLISRAEAIEAIELVDWYHQNSNKDMIHGANDDEHQAWYKADDVYKALEAVPSAGRPRGEWMNDEHDMPRCSNCGYMPEFNKHIDDYYYSDFCPNCGADMRGEDE